MSEGAVWMQALVSRQIVETSRVGWVNSLSRQAWSSIVIKLQLWLLSTVVQTNTLHMSFENTIPNDCCLK